jgi:hypothetical protein
MLGCVSYLASASWRTEIRHLADIILRILPNAGDEKHMTWSKYRRLCLVLVLPLLIAGYLCARGFWPYDRYVHILCELRETGEYCRPVGPPEGEFYKEVKKEAGTPAWVPITPSSRKRGDFIYPWVEATQLHVAFSEILSARNYVGQGPDTANVMQRLIGMKGFMTLGFKDKALHSSIIEDFASLYCNSLEFGVQPGTYETVCYGNDFGGPITFRIAGGSSRQLLDGLNTAIEKEINEKRADYLFYRIAAYPMFVYLLLILSVLGWIAQKATRFVKAG